MKKLLRVTFSIIFAAAFALSICACSFRGKSTDVLSQADFEKNLGDGYTFTDLTSQYKKEYPKATLVIDALNADTGLEIQMWKFEIDKNANQYFFNRCKTIKYNCPDDYTIDKGKKINVAEGRNATNYYRLASNGNTCLYMITTLTDEGKARDIFSRLGFSES